MASQQPNVILEQGLLIQPEPETCALISFFFQSLFYPLLHEMVCEREMGGAVPTLAKVIGLSINM